jgi:hypothetical protein
MAIRPPGDLGVGLCCRLPAKADLNLDDPRGAAERTKRVLKSQESKPGFQRLVNVMDFRQYSVFGEAQGYCGWYSR